MILRTFFVTIFDMYLVPLLVFDLLHVLLST